MVLIPMRKGFPGLVAAMVALLLLLDCVSASAQSRSERTIATALRGMYTDDVGEARYFLNWLDLNGDGRREAIAHVVAPRRVWNGRL